MLKFRSQPFRGIAPPGNALRKSQENLLFDRILRRERFEIKRQAAQIRYYQERMRQLSLPLALEQ